MLYESSKLIHGRPYRNPKCGGVHLGVFAHFKPTGTSGDTAHHYADKEGKTKARRSWDKIVRAARGASQRHVRHNTFRQAASVEPDSPVFADYTLTEADYGKSKRGVRGRGGGDGGRDGGSGGGEQDSQSVTFRNRGDKALWLVWSGPGMQVFQGLVHPGESTGMMSYPGHVFFFAEPPADPDAPPGGGESDIYEEYTTFGHPLPENLVEPLKGGVFRVRDGKGLYTYPGGLDEL